MKAIILFVVILIAAAYWHVNNKIQTLVDSTLAQLRAFGITITYSDISNPLDGSVALNNLNIRGLTEDEFDIQSVEMRLPDFISLLKLEDTLNDNQLPSNIQFSINRISMKMDFVIANFKPSQLEWSTDRIKAAGCGDVQTVGYELYPELGYDLYEASIKLGFAHDQSSNKMTLSGEFIGHYDRSYSFSVTFRDIKSLSSTRQYIGVGVADASFEKFEIVIRDLGFNGRYRQFCADKTGVQESEYIDHHLRQLRGYLTRGNIELSDEIYTAYGELLTDDAVITLNLNPPSAAAMNYLGLYKPSDWPAVLGMDVYVNDKKLNDLTMNWDADQAKKYLRDAPIDNAIASKPKQPEIIAKIIPIEPVQTTLSKQSIWYPVPAGELARHVGRLIKLVTKQGKERKGYLVRVEDRTVFISTKLSGKGLAFGLSKTEIANAEVYEAAK